MVKPKRTRSPWSTRAKNQDTDRRRMSSAKVTPITLRVLKAASILYGAPDYETIEAALREYHGKLFSSIEADNA